jgi:pantetheine-phosphate adenylyltransferase
MIRKALFAGSFDPFTLGHESIVEHTLDSLADEVVIGIGINENKHYLFPLDKRLEIIREVYHDNNRVSVEAYNGLTTDFAKTIGAHFLVRGVRTTAEFDFEKTIADINRRLTGIETALLITSPEVSCISSSAVRELMSFGHDVRQWVPEAVYRHIQQLPTSPHLTH